MHLLPSGSDEQPRADGRRRSVSELPNPVQEKKVSHHRRLRLSAPTGDRKLSLPCTLRMRARCKRSCWSSIPASDSSTSIWRGFCEELSATTAAPSLESRLPLRLLRCWRLERRWVRVVSIGWVVVGGVSIRESVESLARCVGLEKGGEVSGPSCRTSSAVVASVCSLSAAN
jgi:hypothetical protein